MKHVLTHQEIATACSEYVVRKHYSDGIWDARTTVQTLKFEEGSVKLSSLNLQERGVISEIFVEVQPHEDKTAKEAKGKP